MDIGSAKSEFSLPGLHVYAARILLYLAEDSILRAVRRGVVNDKHVKAVGKSHHCIDDFPYILNLVICRYYDQSLTH